MPSTHRHAELAQLLIAPPRALLNAAVSEMQSGAPPLSQTVIRGTDLPTISNTSAAPVLDAGRRRYVEDAARPDEQTGSRR
eukprot:SAG31_NODE_4136_length_3549_cov_13.673333_6_plen_81_part_00